MFSSTKLVQTLLWLCVKLLILPLSPLFPTSQYYLLFNTYSWGSGSREMVGLRRVLVHTSCVIQWTNNKRTFCAYFFLFRFHQVWQVLLQTSKNHTQCQIIDTTTELISPALYCCCLLGLSYAFCINWSGTQRLIDWCKKHKKAPIGSNNREQERQQMWEVCLHFFRVQTIRA